MNFKAWAYKLLNFRDSQAPKERKGSWVYQEEREMLGPLVEEERTASPDSREIKEIKVKWDLQELMEGMELLENLEPPELLGKKENQVS